MCRLWIESENVFSGPTINSVPKTEETRLNKNCLYSKSGKICVCSKLLEDEHLFHETQIFWLISHLKMKDF